MPPTSITQQTESLPFEVREFGGKPFFVFDDGMIAVEEVKMMRSDSSRVRVKTPDPIWAEFNGRAASPPAPPASPASERPEE